MTYRRHEAHWGSSLEHRTLRFVQKQQARLARGTLLRETCSGSDMLRNGLNVVN